MVLRTQDVLNVAAAKCEVPPYATSLRPYAISLRSPSATSVWCCGISGTELGYGTMGYMVLLLGMLLRPRYDKSGTEIGYGARRRIRGL
eukprot:2047698-Rhodomonas_salina.1